jgi:hypothetical protein
VARAKGLTIRELAARAGSCSGLAFVGTPRTIADEIEAWLEERGSDGFNVMFPWLPGGWTLLRKGSSPNSSDAACSARTMREPRCATIWAAPSGQPVLSGIGLKRNPQDRRQTRCYVAGKGLMPSRKA